MLARDHAEVPELDRSARDALYAFAYEMLEREQLLHALQGFRVLVRFAPTDERAWLGLAACHERLDQPDVAAELYGAGAMVAAPPSVRCHLALARIARSRGDSAEAEEHLETARRSADERDDADLQALVEHEWRQS